MSSIDTFVQIVHQHKVLTKVWNVQLVINTFIYFIRLYNLRYSKATLKTLKTEEDRDFQDEELQIFESCSKFFEYS